MLVAPRVLTGNDVTLREYLRDRWWFVVAVAITAGLALWFHFYTPPPPPEPVPTADVVVHFPGTMASDRPLLLYSGLLGGTCYTFTMRVGTASSDITLPGMSYDSSCRIEFDVFAPRFGSYGRTLSTSNSTDKAWLNAALASGNVDITLLDQTPLPVSIWIVADNAADRSTAKILLDSQLPEVAPIFEKFGAGVSLADTPEQYLTTSAFGEPFCTNGNAISMNAAIYNPATINVYYVQSYENSDNPDYGDDCWETGHPEIVFVSWGKSNNPIVVLAHEFGHALGLIHPKDVGDHTNGVAAFDSHPDRHNLMRSGDKQVTSISVGQLYNMNFSAESWFNGASSPFVRAVKRYCQDTWYSGECPALTLFQAGWPP